jgi:hypothetical protein
MPDTKPDLFLDEDATLAEATSSARKSIGLLAMKN